MMTYKQIQRSLKAHGFDPGRIDGVPGGRTRKAVELFQAARFLFVDGLPGLVTQEALRQPASDAAPVPTMPVKELVLASGGSLAIGRVARPIREVAIHCTATQAGKPVSRAAVRKMHLARGFSDIGYHALVHLDGGAEIGRAWSLVGAHVEGHNTGSLGIAYVGGVLDPAGRQTADTRTEAQTTTLRELLAAIVAAFPAVRTIKGHRDYSPDRNANGLVEPSEWVKSCPCFEAAAEYRELLPAAA